MFITPYEDKYTVLDRAWSFKVKEQGGWENRNFEEFKEWLKERYNLTLKESGPHAFLQGSKEDYTFFVLEWS